MIHEEIGQNLEILLVNQKNVGQNLKKGRTSMVYRRLHEES